MGDLCLSVRWINIVINLNLIGKVVCFLIVFLGCEYYIFYDIYMVFSEWYVIGVLIDIYSVGSSKEEFENEYLWVNKILDFFFIYGVVMGNEVRKFRWCFKDYIEKGFVIEIVYYI